MQTLQESPPCYTVPPSLQELLKEGAFKSLRMMTVEDLTPMSKEEQRQQHREELRQERRAEREAKREWNSAGDIRRLALELGTAGVFSAQSDRGTQGEYVDGTIPNDWTMSRRLRAKLNYKTEMQNMPVILIDVEQAMPQDGISAVIAHEIGHQIDNLANPRY